jgi:hypothetical protein
MGKLQNELVYKYLGHLRYEEIERFENNKEMSIKNVV